MKLFDPSFLTSQGWSIKSLERQRHAALKLKAHILKNSSLTSINIGGVKFGVHEKEKSLLLLALRSCVFCTVQIDKLLVADQ